MRTAQSYGLSFPKIISARIDDVVLCVPKTSSVFDLMNELLNVNAPCITRFRTARSA